MASGTAPGDTPAGAVGAPEAGTAAAASPAAGSVPRSATSSTLANGVPWLIGTLPTRKPSPASSASQSASGRPQVGACAVAAQARHRAVDPLAGGVAGAVGHVADAQQQPAAGLQRVAQAFEDVPLRVEVDVVQHVEDDGDVARRERRLAHVGADEGGPRVEHVEGGAGTLDVARHQLDAAVAPAAARHARRPAAGARAERGEQAGEQALAAADVEHADRRRVAALRRVRAVREQAVRGEVAEHRVAAELAAREMPGEPARGAVGQAGGAMQRRPVEGGGVVRGGRGGQRRRHRAAGGVRPGHRRTPAWRCAGPGIARAIAAALAAAEGRGAGPRGGRRAARSCLMPAPP